MADRALIIFARLPEPGRVKTRLAATVGDAFATEFYRLCAEQVIGETETVQGALQRYLFYADAGNGARLQTWLGDALQIAPQTNGDLGTRIRHAFESVFAGGAQRAVIIATDTPDLAAKHIEAALAALDTYDVALGPTVDGGYYLLALKPPLPDIFSGIAWSTPAVLGETRVAIARAGLTCADLPVLRDIDTEADLRAWIAESEAVPVPLSRLLVRAGLAE